MDEHTGPTSAEHRTGSAGHEQRDVTFGPIVWGAVGTVVVLVLIFFLVRWTFVSYVGREAAQSPPANPLAGSYGRQLPPAPRLQARPVQDLNELHAAEDAVLDTYGWVDRQAGVVRIPIARAMQLLVERGLPTAPRAGEPR